MPTDEDGLTRAIGAPASKYERHGYRRVIALLQAAGWGVTFGYNGVFLSDARLDPVWAGPSRRKAVAFAHKILAGDRLLQLTGECEPVVMRR